jgi:hypothetical protein
VRAAAFLVALAACGGGTAAPALEEPPIPQAPAGTDREALKRETELVEDLSRRGCECQDQACLAKIDEELRTYYREKATINDPVEDVETWPADLDARARRSDRALEACMDSKGYISYARGVLFARRIALLRDAACSCKDGACVDKVRRRLDESVAAAADLLADQPTLQEISAASTEMRGCFAAGLGDVIQQALLDLKAMRRDACACSDADCTAAVSARFDGWLDDHKATPTTPEVKEQVTQVAAELGACLRAFDEESP